MAEVSRSALLMYSADEMYRLVNDVDSYPEFLPGCAATDVITCSESLMRVSVNVAKAGISQTFITENTLDEGRSISMELVEGPFNHLTGGWVFTELDDHVCKVSLDLKFEFSSALVEIVFGRIFNELVGAMVKSFALRAKEVYGTR